jgi:hypothetical protein
MNNFVSAMERAGTDFHARAWKVRFPRDAAKLRADAEKAYWRKSLDFSLLVWGEARVREIAVMMDIKRRDTLVSGVLNEILKRGS